MRDFLQRLVQYLSSKRQRVPSLNYDLVLTLHHNGQPVATLSNPIVPDQFWTEFEMTPLTSNPDLLESLYSAEAWLRSEFDLITPAGTKIDFLLSGEHVSYDGERPTIPIGSRPARVSIRF